MLKHIYAASDSLNLQLEQNSDGFVQKVFYNVRTHDQYAGNVFVFAPNGFIIACAVNAPQHMHDSCIAEWGAVYGNLQAM